MPHPRTAHDADLARMKVANGATTPRDTPYPANPPPGAWYRDDGITKELSASTRRLGLACAMAFLCLLLLALAGTIVWATGGNILRGLSLLPAEQGRPSEPGFALLLIAANLPCLGLLAFLAFYTAVLIAGSVRIRLSHGTLELARGIGPLRHTRRLRASDIVSLHESTRIVQAENAPATIKEIILANRGAKPVRFGGSLNDEGRWWLRGTLAHLLNVPDTTEHDERDHDHEPDDESKDREPPAAAGGSPSRGRV